MLRIADESRILNKASKFRKMPDGQAVTVQGLTEIVGQAGLAVKCMDELGGQVRGYLRNLE